MPRSALAALLLAAACGKSPRSSARDAPARTPPVDAAVAAAACVVTLTTGRNGSVLDEQRSVGPPAYDFFATYPAATIDPVAQAPVKLVEQYQIGGRPLLWYTADKAGVVVDAAAMSELVVADATRMRAGETARVGQVLGEIPGRELALFLVHARAIATWVHIGAELCLAEERSVDGAYTARFTGEHTYFTNEENVEPLDFEVTIAADGVITVTAR